MRIVGFVFGVLFLFLRMAYGQSVSCPVSDSEKAFLEDAIQKFVLDSIFTAGLSGITPNATLTKVHFGYSSTLLGQVPTPAGKSDPGVRETASLLELCTGPKAFEPTCRSDKGVPAQDAFWKGHDVCVQVRCEAKDVYRAEIQWSVIPSEENARFAYSAVKNQEILYDPAPSVTWRLDDRLPNRLIVTGEMIAAAIVKQDGKSLRVIYTGNVTATTTEEEGLSSIILNMTFPLVSLVPARAEFLLHHHNDSAANGSIAIGQKKLATLTLLPGQPLDITWGSECK